MSQAEVEAILGKPATVLTKGTRLVLLYPKNGRVELEQDVAVSIANLPIETGDFSASPAPPTPERTDTAAKPPPTEEDQA